MLVIKSISELTNSIDKLKEKKKTISFVPTMGNLHEGHLHLVSLATSKADIVIVSIFVNPLQFNQSDDLKNYPRTLERDLNQCEQHGVNIIFAPTSKEFYPNGGELERIELSELTELSSKLEGKSRPDHFSGVITVVKKFFELVRPDFAIFGEKDFQQLLIIKKMVKVLNLPLKIIASKTIREENGLAMSSRNSKLQKDELLKATQIVKVLNSIRNQILTGNNDFLELTNSGLTQLSKFGIKPDYLEVCDCNDLQLALVDNNNDRVILIAAWIGTTRLIDNMRV